MTRGVNIHHCLLFQTGDHPLVFLGIGGGTRAALSPALFPERDGQALLQLLDAAHEPGAASLRVVEVGLERGAADGSGTVDGSRAPSPPRVPGI